MRSPFAIQSEVHQYTLQHQVPFNALIEITYACNHRCDYCYNSPEKSRQELKTHEIIKILDQLRDLGCFTLILTGGEILARKDFFEIGSHARKNG